MSTYRGTAALLFGDGRQVDAVVNLSKDASGTWGGDLVFPAEARTPELLNLAEGRVRIGNRDGAFVRPDLSDWTRFPAGWLRLRIEGNGDAPF